MENKTRIKDSSFLIMLCLVFLVAGCGEKSVGEKIEDTIKSERGDEKAIDIKHRVHHFKLEGFTKKGDDQWYLEGEFAKLIDSDIVLSKIKGKTLDKDLTVMLTADNGIYNRISGCTELKGNVIITTSDGGKVTMDFARWNAAEEEVKTDSHVRIEHGSIVLEGMGALVRPKEKWAILEKEIKATDISKRVITCDGPLEVDYEKRRAIFNNNVEITDPQSKMYANKVVAYFDPEKRSIEKVEWLGDVKCIY